MNSDLIEQLQSFAPDQARLTRCQVDVQFPPGLKPSRQPHCPWYAEFGGRPQIVEVTDTGWEIYHFESLRSAQRFAAATRARLAFAIAVQLRATIEIAEG